MKKIFTLAALALMTSMMFVGCSSDDDNNTQPTPTPAPTPTPDPDPTPTPDNPLAGTWTVVTDGWMQYTVSTFVMSNKPIVDYSAANTSVNPTIPAGTPTYSLVTNDVDPTTGTTSNFSKEEGYYTLPEPVVTTNAAGETVSTIPSMGTITLWPQVVMTSFDGSTWTATPKADMVSRHEYTYQKIGNVLVLTRGDKTTATFTSKPATTATTIPADGFFKSWTLPNDTDPTITTSLLMSAQPVTNYLPAGATNPTIPAGTPSYVKEVAFLRQGGQAHRPDRCRWWHMEQGNRLLHAACLNDHPDRGRHKRHHASRHWQDHLLATVYDDQRRRNYVDYGATHRPDANNA